MTTVLALDLARNSGWAVVSPNGAVAGSWSLLDGIPTSGRGKTPLDVQHVIQMQRLRSGIDMLIRTHRPDVVAIEREFGRGSGTRLLVSLFAAAQEAAYTAGLPTLSITVGAVAQARPRDREGRYRTLQSRSPPHVRRGRHHRSRR